MVASQWNSITCRDPSKVDTLVEFVQAAGLTEVVSDDEAALTVLAPSNAAFAKIPQEELNSILADKAKLTSVRIHFSMVQSALQSAFHNDSHPSMST